MYVVGKMEKSFSNDRGQGHDDAQARNRASHQRKLQQLASGKTYFHCGVTNQINYIRFIQFIISDLN